MSSQLRAFLLRGIIGLSVVLAALTPVRAQAVRGVSVNIPFDFVVGGERLWAGDYYLRPDRNVQGVMVIKNSDGMKSWMFMAVFDEQLVPQGRPRLVFHRYQDQYFLREVWLTGAESYGLSESPAERLIEGKVARDGLQRGEVVTIADISRANISR